MGLLAKICGCGVRTALDQQREAMRRELSELASQLGVHGSALAELFRLELGEYMRRQRRRMALLIAGGACAALAYISFWILLSAASHVFSPKRSSSPVTSKQASNRRLSLPIRDANSKTICNVSRFSSKKRRHPDANRRFENRRSRSGRSLATASRRSGGFPPKTAGSRRRLRRGAGGSCGFPSGAPRSRSARDVRLRPFANCPGGAFSDPRAAGARDRPMDRRRCVSAVAAKLGNSAVFA